MRIKICCIASLAEARLAIDAGADAVGLVSAMPSGPGPIPDADIAAIAARVPPPVASFLLTARQDVVAIVSQQRQCGASTLQLVDELQLGSYAQLRAALPGIRLVQVVHVTGPAALAQALAVAAHVDALLLDSGNPQLAVKQLGGTGRTHNWAISRQIRERAGVPVLLAGGLNADNVAAAIMQVQPFAVDVCSGVRSHGRLDPDKLRRFINAARGAGHAA